MRKQNKPCLSPSINREPLVLLRRQAPSVHGWGGITYTLLVEYKTPREEGRIEVPHKDEVCGRRQTSMFLGIKRELMF